jgi:hypothetical protein
MKKQFKLMALASAAMLFAACSQDNLMSPQELSQNAPENNAIQFGTYLGNQTFTRSDVPADYTKGMIGNADGENTKNLTKARFGVFGYYTVAKNYRGETTTPNPFDWESTSADGTWKKDETNKYPNFMYNEQLKYDDTKSWYYENVKYWPNGTDAVNQANAPSNTAGEQNSGKLSFFAYAPYMQEGTTNTTGTLPTVKGIVTAKNVNTAKQLTYTPSGGSETTVDNGIVAISDNTSPTNVWVKYVMPVASEKDAVDLLWGVRGQYTYSETQGNNTISNLGKLYNENLTKQSVDERVKFLFKHALAKIAGSTAQTTGETTTGNPLKGGLKVVVDVDKNSLTPTQNGQSDQTSYFNVDFDNTKTLVTLKSVKIQDAHSAWVDRSNNGIATGATEMHSDLANVGWFNIEEGTWANTEVNGTEGAQYNIEINNVNNNTGDDTYTLNEAIKETGAATSTDGVKKVVSGYSWTTPTYPSGVTTTPQDVFCNENVPGLVIIPGSASQTLYFTVDYYVRTADSKLAGGYTEVEQVITNKVDFASLDPNKYYTIIMHLGLTSVKFEAVVADWSTTETYYDEDGHAITPTTPANENREVIWLPSNVVAYSASVDNVEAAATSTTFSFASGYANFGTYTGYTSNDGNITGVSVDGTTATINLTANTLTTRKVSHVTLVGTEGSIVVTVTQLPVALTVSSPTVTAGNTAVTIRVTSPSTDLSSETINVTAKDGTDNDVPLTTGAATFASDHTNIAVTLSTAPEAGKKITFTVTVNEATGSTGEITVTAP